MIRDFSNVYKRNWKENIMDLEVAYNSPVYSKNFLHLSSSATKFTLRLFCLRLYLSKPPQYPIPLLIFKIKLDFFWKHKKNNNWMFNVWGSSHAVIIMVKSGFLPKFQGQRDRIRGLYRLMGCLQRVLETKQATDAFLLGKNMQRYYWLKMTA